mgnify:CR=1 FL=1
MLGYERKLTYTDTVNTKTANNLLELSSEQVIRREEYEEHGTSMKATIGKNFLKQTA